ncbi:hypothetical protein MYCFIDRAFT_177811 [Lecanosticta acicola]|uniref:F-box domain-containing protein n=1 Tax=Lecanosticta acicola TaxID=111012 RepID=A0AAI8YS13_9PEZI|nr:hypothetical protein MYCFIDRAFT_177811 [Lecanosticta acicola]
MAPLLDLPAECKLSIFYFLPVTDVARSRRVCRNFDQLIQNPQNRNIILKEREMQELADFKSTVQRICYFDVSATPSAFVNALQVFFSHRGISDSLMRKHDSEDFVNLWVRQQGTQHTHEHELCAIVVHILWAFVECHVPSLYKPELHHFDKCNMRPRFPIPEAGLQSIAQWDKIKERITYPIHGLWDVKVARQPSCPQLTDQNEYPHYRKGWGSAMGIGALGRLLDVKLPMPIFADGCCWYKLKSERLFQEVLSAMEKQCRLEPLLRAAIIEDLYIW